MSAALGVDLVIAAHDPERPVPRAAGSALAGSSDRVRVTVVAHDTPVDGIAAALGPLVDHPRLRILLLHDGIRSPAGPFNAGLDAATARFTSVMGSDDELEPGALDAWLDLAETSGADAVIPRLRHAGGRAIPTPPVRVPHRRRLLPVADRLAYRTAPLGLVDRSALGSLRFTPGLASGEDLEYGVRAWFAARTIAYGGGLPAYIVHGDARSRATLATRPVADDLAAVNLLIGGEWFAGLNADARRAIVIKTIRIHVFGAVANRRDPAEWTPEDHAALARTVEELRRGAPSAEQSLSIIDRRLLDACADRGSAPATLISLAQRRLRRAAPGNLVPRHPLALLDREGPLRFAAASAAMLR
ncbi:Glycosyltransferase like family 2 [Microbacterium sp. cf046]|uniref:glycosyltransferase family A protein n=1 Tax=Microbacterium sp. cf046 TaxID=1761803 RepID=UPI0008EFFE7F|nr:glycosyltransferase family A protein [Microbacterium sp. cf046]SFR95718.1 Glycosyltransferase like family 2 [Microbacterium sp. cf046]